MAVPPRAVNAIFVCPINGELWQPNPERDLTHEIADSETHDQKALAELVSGD